MVYVSNQDKKMGSTFTTNNENAKAASVRGTNYSSGDPFGVFGLSQPGRPTPKVYKKPELIFRDVTTLVNHDNPINKPDDHLVGSHFLTRLENDFTKSSVRIFAENDNKPSFNNPFSAEGDVIQRPTPISNGVMVKQVMEGRSLLRENDENDADLLKNSKSMLEKSRLASQEPGDNIEEVLFQARSLPISGATIARGRAMRRKRDPSFFDNSITMRPLERRDESGAVDHFNL